MEIWSEKKSLQKSSVSLFVVFPCPNPKKKSEAPPQFLTPAPHSSAWAISTSAACDERPSTDWQILCFTPRYRWPSWQHLVPWSGPLKIHRPRRHGAQSGFVLICHTSISSVHSDIYLEPIKKKEVHSEQIFPSGPARRCIFTFPKCLNHGMLGEFHEQRKKPEMKTCRSIWYLKLHPMGFWYLVWKVDLFHGNRLFLIPSSHIWNSTFFPTCQVRVVRLYQSCSSASYPPPAPPAPPATPAPPTPPPPPPPPLLPPLLPLPRPLLPCQLFAKLFANVRAQRAPLDLNLGPSQLSVHRCQIECQKICQIECQKICQIESQKVCQIECQKKCQIECQKICQIKCQNVCQIECQKICQIICQKICQIECQKICQNICQKICQIECQKICQIECQIECQKICQIECQKICQ